MNIKKIALMLFVGCGTTAALTSCSDILETESELVEYEKDNTLNHPTLSFFHEWINIHTYYNHSHYYYYDNY